MQKVLKGSTRYWFDARVAASMVSSATGWAWLVPVLGGWVVVSGETQDDKPEGFVAEFKDGEEQ